MAESEYVGVQVTPNERQQIEALAQRQGYSTLADYLRALIESDAKAHGDTLPFDDNDIDPVASFRQGWQEAMTGNVRPLSELWDELDKV